MAVTPPGMSVLFCALVGVEPHTCRLDSDGNRAFLLAKRRCATRDERLRTHKERTALWVTHTLTRRSSRHSSASSGATLRRAGEGGGQPLSRGRSHSVIG